MGRWIKYVLYTVEATSAPLLVASILAVVTGYGMVNPRVVRELTGGLLGYGAAARVHTSPLLRLSFSLLTILHSASGALVLIERRVKARLAKMALRIVVAAVLAWLSAVVALAELL